MNHRTVPAAVGALLVLVASFISWGTFTAPVTLPRPMPGLLMNDVFEGMVHTFQLTGWNGNALGIPFWLDVLAAILVAALWFRQLHVATMITAGLVSLHLGVAAFTLVTEPQASLGPGLFMTAVISVVFFVHATRGYFGTRRGEPSPMVTQ